MYFQLRYEPGANVIVPFPAFQTLYEVPKYLGYEVKLLGLKPEHKFRIDIKKMESLIDDKTKIIVLNNPHNPTGMKLTDTELDEIFKIAEKHNIEILADEHYRFMPYGDEKLIPSLYNKSKNVVAVGSMIKCYSCVGLRVGWIIGSKELINNCRDFKDYTTHTISQMNDLIAQKLLLNGDNIINENKQWILKNIDEFKNFIAKNKEFIDCVEPQGGIVAFPFLKDKSISSALFARKLVEKTNVSILPGDVFEKPGYFRIGFGIRPEIFRQAIQFISEFIKDEQWKK